MDHRWSRLGTLAVGLALAFGAGRAAVAQDEESGKSKLAEQLNKVLSDPTEMEKLEKEKRPPLEIFKSMVLPNDVLPYVKANHWGTMAVELRSNQINYNGLLETLPVRLRDMPQEVVFRRDAGLVKGQRSSLRLQIMTPAVPKELLLRLLRPDSLRDDETYSAALRVLEPHQMLIPVLTKGPNDAYGRWNQLRAFFPLSGLKSDQAVYDKQRYYRMVLPSDVEHPLLPTHPLTWTTISHVIWDGLPPDTLSISQQEAMVDWLHWGGQLVIVGGAGPNFAPLRESFLAPFLPADVPGQSVQLTGEDLSEFANAYPPLPPSVDPDDPIEGTQTYASAFEEAGRRYKNPDPILVERGKPIYLSTLVPKPGARAIGLGKPGLPPLGVEWRVGRGRVLMVGLSLVDPTLIAWPGYDTMIRRVVLRRPEEPRVEELRYTGNGIGGFLPPRYDFLHGPDLTWVRIFGRDLGAPTRRARLEEDDPNAPQSTLATTSTLTSPIPPRPSRGGGTADVAAMYNPWEVPVAEWLDSSDLPKMGRDALERASGIEIPGRRFVLMVILAYVIALVPINWLICRFALGRREWAWVAVPLLAIGFAVVVERAAAYDVGYDSCCNEIDLIETYGDYPRGHLNRFASLYTTGRVRYAISYPTDPSALALPMSTGRSIRGEDVQRSTFQATPTPTLADFQVQPRSLAMFRAEQYVNLPGGVTLRDEDGVRKVYNGTEAELRDAVVVAIGERGSTVTPLGRIGPKSETVVEGESVPLEKYEPPTDPDQKKNEVDPRPFLALLVRSSTAARPEDAGEVRLLAWTAKPQAGQVIDPPVDLHQGFTLVVAHLKIGPTPDPASLRYDVLANGPERPSTAMLNTPPPPPPNPGMMPGMSRRGAAPAPAQPRVTPMPAGALPAAPVPKAVPKNARNQPPSTPDDPEPPDAPPGPDGADPGATTAPEKPRR